MQIKPLYDRVLVVPYKENQESVFIIPEEQNSEKMQVLALGDKTSGQIKQGDIVLINKYAGGTFNINGKSYTLIKECDILGIIEGENKWAKIFYMALKE